MTQERFKLAATAHIFFLRQQEILLLRRYNTGYEDGNYSVVAGHLDGNEEVIRAAIREAYEEAGVKLTPDDLAIVGIMHRKTADGEWINFFLSAHTWQGEITNCEPDKCDQLLWCNLNQLPENTIPYIRTAIENYQRNIWFTSFGWENKG